MTPHVVVMGVQGCGKSTVGSLLAARLGVPFVDADDLHPPANRAKMAAGRPLDDADRGPWLRAVADRLAAPGGIVVACSALRRRYRDTLRSAGQITFVYLAGAPELIAQRLAARHHEYMPAGLLATQLATLEEPGADEGAIRLDIRAPADRLVDRAFLALTTTTKG